MDNTFYNEFDTEVVGDRYPDYRTPFQVGRDRIIYSSAFRRLQAKTQVFSVGEYDFYRTRLTHSIEVAQIGRSICGYLRTNSPHQSATCHLDQDLVESICLAHDLGHPPFGHAGERALHEVMAPHGGFEGNAQTLRILTETIFARDDRRRGMRPTRALMDGILKYKTLHRELDLPHHHFLYDDQEAQLAFVHEGWPLLEAVPPGRERDAQRSVECQVMDWADDTAYTLMDLTDGIRAAFLTPHRIERWAEEKSLAGDDATSIEFVIRAIREGDIDRAFSSQVGEFIQGCRLEKREHPLAAVTQRYAFQLGVDPRMSARAKLYNRMAVDLVFRTAELQQLEFKTKQIVTRLFHALHENYVGTPRHPLVLLPARRERALQREERPEVRVRLLCDYLAGMTDAFAVRTYKRLFDPQFGSIVDLV